MLELKRMINKVRVENGFSPMSAILAERLLIYVAYGNFLVKEFHGHAFAERDKKYNVIRSGDQFKMEDREEAVAIALEVNPRIWDQSNENLINNAILIAL